MLFFKSELIKNSSITSEKNQDETNNGATNSVVTPIIGATASSSVGYRKHQGQGDAFENANHLVDKLTGHDASIIGDVRDPETGHIIRAGADRVVDGVKIQSKCWVTPSKTIGDCFENGQYKYFNSDGSPMSIEVPKDQYDECIKIMRKRISEGKVPGVTDPNEAENLVRKGHFSYKTCKNIAKAGTIESVAFDAAGGVIIGTQSGLISAAITYAISIWNDMEPKDALKLAASQGLKVGGSAFATYVITSQLTKTKLAKGLEKDVQKALDVLNKSKLGKMLVDGNFKLITMSDTLFGRAVTRSQASVFATKGLTDAVTLAVMVAPDAVDMIGNKISGAQFAKNAFVNTAGFAGGAAGGALAGAALAAAIANPAGWVVTGVVGIASMISGQKISGLANQFASMYYKSDAEDMFMVVSNVYASLAQDYLISEKEGNEISKKIERAFDQKTIKEMYASHNRPKFAQNILVRIIEEVLSKRKHIELPTSEEMLNEMTIIVSEVVSEMEQNSPESFIEPVNETGAFSFELCVPTEEYNFNDECLKNDEGTIVIKNKLVNLRLNKKGIINAQTVLFEDCVINMKGNCANSFTVQGGNAVFRRCTFNADNKATEHPRIYVSGGTLSIENCLFENCIFTTNAEHTYSDDYSDKDNAFIICSAKSKETPANVLLNGCIISNCTGVILQNGRYYDSNQSPNEIQPLRKHCSINNCFVSGHKDKLFINTNCSYENAFVISKCRFEKCTSEPITQKPSIFCFSPITLQMELIESNQASIHIDSSYFSEIDNPVFKGSSSDEDFDPYSSITNCIFNNITVNNGQVIGYGDGRSLIDKCHFINVTGTIAFGGFLEVEGKHHYITNTLFDDCELNISIGNTNMNNCLFKDSKLLLTIDRVKRCYSTVSDCIFISCTNNVSFLTGREKHMLIESDNLVDKQISGTVENTVFINCPDPPIKEECTILGRFDRIIEIVGIETSNNYSLKCNENDNNCNKAKKLLNEFMENTGFDLSFVM